MITLTPVQSVWLSAQFKPWRNDILGVILATACPYCQFIADEPGPHLKEVIAALARAEWIDYDALQVLEGILYKLLCIEHSFSDKLVPWEAEISSWQRASAIPTPQEIREVEEEDESAEQELEVLKLDFLSVLRHVAGGLVYVGHTREGVEMAGAAEMLVISGEVARQMAIPAVGLSLGRALRYTWADPFNKGAG